MGTKGHKNLLRVYGYIRSKMKTWKSTGLLRKQITEDAAEFKLTLKNCRNVKTTRFQLSSKCFLSTWRRR